MGIPLPFSSAYPVALDAFPLLTDGVHIVEASHPNSLGDAVEALEAKMGITNSLVVTSVDYILRMGRPVSEQPGGNTGSIAYLLDTLNAHTTTDILLSLQSAGTERLRVEAEGDVVVGVGGSGILTLGSTDVTKRIIADQDPAPDGEIRYNPATNQWELSNNGGGFSAIGVAGGGTLDTSYDFGGPGAGRAITADSGAVTIDDTVNDATNAFEVGRTTGTGAAALFTRNNNNPVVVLRNDIAGAPSATSYAELVLRHGDLTRPTVAWRPYGRVSFYGPDWAAPGGSVDSPMAHIGGGFGEGFGVGPYDNNGVIEFGMVGDNKTYATRLLLESSAGELRFYNTQPEDAYYTVEDDTTPLGLGMGHTAWGAYYFEAFQNFSNSNVLVASHYYGRRVMSVSGHGRMWLHGMAVDWDDVDCGAEYLLEAPTLYFWHEAYSATWDPPGDGVVAGVLNFQSYSDNWSFVEYAKIKAVGTDVSDTVEIGAIDFYTSIAGSNASRTLRMEHGGLYVTERAAMVDPTAASIGAFWVFDNGAGVNLPYFTDGAGDDHALAYAGTGLGTLDQAYDFGGAGAGRTITADAGGVTINNAANDTSTCLSVSKTVGTGSALSAFHAAGQLALKLENNITTAAGTGSPKQRFVSYVLGNVARNFDIEALSSAGSDAYRLAFTNNAGTTLMEINQDSIITFYELSDIAGASPVFDLYHWRATPTDGDTAGILRFSGRSDGPAKVTAGEIRGVLTDITSGTEDARIDFKTAGTGSLRDALSVWSADGATTYVGKGGAAAFTFETVSPSVSIQYLIIGVQVQSYNALTLVSDTDGVPTTLALGNAGAATVLSNTVDVAASAPVLDIYHNRATPTDGDTAGFLRFSAMSSTPAKFTTAEVSSVVSDVTAAAEIGALYVKIMDAGTLRESARFEPSVTTLTYTNDDTVGPRVDFFHSSTTPAADDVIGEIRFDAMADYAPDFRYTYASIKAEIIDPAYAEFEASPTDSPNARLSFFTSGRLSGSGPTLALFTRDDTSQPVLYAPPAGSSTVPAFTLRTGADTSASSKLLSVEDNGTYTANGTELFVLSGDGSLFLNGVTLTSADAFAYKKHTGFSGSGVYRTSTAFKSTLTTFETAWTLPLTDARTYWIQVKATGRNSAGDTWVHARVFAGFHRQGGGAVRDYIVVPDLFRTDATYDIDIVASGNNALLQVHGQTAPGAEDVYWAFEIEYQSVGTDA